MGNQMRQVYRNRITATLIGVLKQSSRLGYWRYYSTTSRGYTVETRNANASNQLSTIRYQLSATTIIGQPAMRGAENCRCIVYRAEIRRRNRGV